MFSISSVPSSSPRIIGGEALSSSSLLLTWQPPPASQINGILIGYIVNMTETVSGNQFQISTNNTEYTFGGLHPFYRYTFIIAAVTVGQGPFGEIFSLTTPQDGMNHYYVAKYTIESF